MHDADARSRWNAAGETDRGDLRDDTDRERWRERLRSRFATAEWPGVFEEASAAALWNALGPLELRFVAKAWAEGTEGWLAVTPEALVFVTVGGQIPFRAPVDTVRARLARRRWPASIFQGPSLCLESPDGMSLRLETVWHDDALAAIEGAREEGSPTGPPRRRN